MWLVALTKVNMHDVLQKRRPYMIISPNICFSCMEEVESTNHIFMWSHFFSVMGIKWVLPKDVMDLVRQ